ncbi:hypothetical protein DPMN_164448 [Dreissena polymorpha]|uniref:Uncharacterized protein n=1 Tax=Dreissena polymorpha TaxID=45954 RepID=A0A9D4EXV0_DREPO|nr:hypothetical protein DPMN_164448 [Dreissena polymorpha]
MNDFADWYVIKYGALTEKYVLATQVQNTNQCNYSPFTTLPSYMECTCRSREYTCIIKNLTLDQDGDQWRCKGAPTIGSEELTSERVTIQTFTVPSGSQAKPVLT